MRKEVKTTEAAYFCDVCGEQINDAYWAYGGYASAGEETERCGICERDTCPQCRSQTERIEGEDVICKECLEVNESIFKSMSENREKCRKELQQLKKKYLDNEKSLKLHPAHKVGENSNDR